MSYQISMIAELFANTIKLSSKFNSIVPISDTSLLFPEFLRQVDACINKYRQTHENQNVVFTETYRSNALQLIYYNRGASKIKEDGMHHFGIAADCIFEIDGKRTYKGDVVGLRKIFKDNGLFILGMWDSMHVQFIPVSAQAALRKAVNHH